MKKSLIALAVLAASGAAMAQSSVTLYGIVDANVGYVNHAGASNSSAYGLGNSGNATSRLGFRGVEDLGGGLKAKFTLEGGLGNDVGGGFDFKRESTVGLAGGFGEVRLGRELTPTFRAINKYDVFNAAGVGRYLGFQDWAATGQTDGNAVRASNMITYATPNFSGFNASVAYAFDEKASTIAGAPKAGRYAGGMVGYDNGPLSVTAAYATLKTGLSGASVDRDTYSIGASYDFGAAKVTGMANQIKYKADGASSSKINTYLIGMSAPVGGVGEVKAQYALYDQKAFNTKAHQFSVGYVHNLSKRTALYGTVAYLKNKDGSAMTLDAAGAYGQSNTLGGIASGQSQVGTQVGIRHAF
ncbi:porin [Comamonas sp. Y33R10-2]|uniref:porin n=1 Tax=Comamonas sp. Y33R10-2 TaxID=2853257 RepID=UPI001C5CAFF7|nr:porin [Comamonas sp. Y33R10-2]QXZ09838.1 porin [Comamonas sp. Y33R10-2]